MVRGALSLWLLALGSSAAIGCAKTPASSEPAPSAAKSDAPPGMTPPPDAVKTASGLAFVVRKPGHGGKHPQPQDQVRVSFVQWKNGEVSDSSQKRGGPTTFDVTGVIAGWTEALQQMQVGEERRLWIPDRLVYPGRSGFPRDPAVFDLELLEITEGKPPPPAPDDVSAVPPDAIKTGSGLAYKLLAKGSGEDEPNAWDRVLLDYTGWTADGAMFETSRRERPTAFDLGTAIPGFREALPLLAVGDRARLWIPEALAYQGRAGQPKGMVVFDVELVSIERKPEPPRPPADVAAAPRDAKRTRSGLAYRVLRKANGKTKPSAHDHVEVSYSAWTTDGVLFDSSVVRGKPVTVPIDRLIPGWAEGLQLMAEGGKALLWIPERLAYGGKPGSPKGTLVYEVELLRVIRE